MSHEAPIFISGCGHSGTTLVLKLLGMHPHIHAIAFESNLATSDTIQADGEEFLRQARAAGKVRWAEKTPKHVYHVQTLAEAFPGAKFLFVRRDGRAVVNSLKKRLRSLKSSIARWSDDNREIDRWLQHDFSYLMRYEDLVDNTETEIRSVLSFLGEPFSPDCVHPDRQPTALCGLSEAVTAHPGEYSKKNHKAYRSWQINQPIYNANASWMTELTPKEQATIANKLGQQLKQYGYGEAHRSVAS